MSNNQDNLETKLSDAKAVAGGMLSKDKHVSANNQTTAVEVAKTGSVKDVVLWLLAAVILIGATCQ